MSTSNTIQIVLVLYNTTLKESLTYQTFKKNIKNRSFYYELIIYNNSPEIDIQTDTSYLLVNSETNEMLAGAYNFALKRAFDTKKKWLLLFDQDTAITEKYLIEIEQFLMSGNVEDFAAVVPLLYKENLHLSPVCYYPILGPFYFIKPIDKVGLDSKKCVIAFNSASLLSVSFMQSIGGFSYVYPLDMQDHWYFYRIFKEKRKVLILKSKLEQNLSLIDIDKSMSIQRYTDFLKALNLFSKEFKFIAKLILKIRLCDFLVSQLVNSRKRKFFKATLNAFFTFKY